MKRLMTLNFLAWIVATMLWSGCRSDEVIDPFWNIQLDTNRETLLETLQSLTQNRELENCVFSYRKESYIKDESLDVRLIGSLDMPSFNNQRVESLSYSLLVESKREEPYTFNRSFFKYFKEMMVSSYGQNLKEIQLEDRIQLYWETDSGDSVEVVVLKEINHYLVDIKF